MYVSCKAGSLRTLWTITGDVHCGLDACHSCCNGRVRNFNCGYIFSHL